MHAAMHAAMHTLYSERFRSLSFSAARCDVSKKRPASAVSVSSCETHSSTWHVAAYGEAQGRPRPRAPAPKPEPQAPSPNLTRRRAWQRMDTSRSSYSTSPASASHTCAQSLVPPCAPPPSSSASTSSAAEPADQTETAWPPPSAAAAAVATTTEPMPALIMALIATERFLRACPTALARRTILSISGHE